MTVQPPPLPIPAGSAIVTPEQQYAEARATHDAVIELKNLVLTTVKDQSKTLDDHEARMRGLEDWRSKAKGAIAAGSVIAALVGAAAGTAAGALGH